MPELVVDGRAHAVAAGQSVLQACLALGYRLPYFCWHPALGSVGACRQCAVLHFRDAADAATGPGRLVMACMTPVTDSIHIALATPRVREFHRLVAEGLMLHHPHDCPVCDEGGHCHLQDMTVMAGHNYRRYRFPKRTFRNQYLGPFLHHEMNRCIQCYRCVRFYREYAGGSDLEAQGISDRVFFGRQHDGVLESGFAGNLAEVCPTGVFTDATLKRHYLRKWDLRWAPSLCVHCGVGCNLSPGERGGRVRVAVNRYHHAVNGYFLCDRGRFGHQYLAAPARVLQARRRGQPLPPAAALDALAGVAAARNHLIGIASPRASLESNFALWRLVGPERFFAGVRAGELEYALRVVELYRQGPARVASVAEAEAADAVLVLGEDVSQSAARLALALRQSVRQAPLARVLPPLHIPPWLDHAAREAVQAERGPLFVATVAATGLDDAATACHRAAPSDLARLGFEVAHQLEASLTGAAEWRQAAQAIATALAAADRPLLVTGNSTGCRALLEATAQIAAALARRGRAPALSVALPECNTLGLAMFAPRPLAEGVELMRLGAAEAVLVVENDLARRLPAAESSSLLALCAGGQRHLALLDQIRHATADAAELVLPAASFADGDGTWVSSEGRAQRAFAVCAPGASVRESWRWIEQAQGRNPQFDEVTAAMASALPALAATVAAAPPASFRLAGEKIPRETQRASGRTALNAQLAVSEPQPPVDPDSALSFTMEGAPTQPPAGLIPYFWSPGWNSPQAAFTYQQEINGPLRGGGAGVRLFEPDGTRAAAAPAEPPARHENTPGEWQLVRLVHLFGSEELSQHGAAIAELAPTAYVGLGATDADAAGWTAGTRLALGLGTRVHVLPLRIVDGLAPGLAAVPAGMTPLEGEDLPTSVHLSPAPEAAC